MSKQRVLGLAKLVIAGLLIWWVIDLAGWGNIRTTLTSIDRTQWAMGLLLIFAVNCLSMIRWHVLMKSVGLNSTPWLALRVGFIGVFFSNVLPGLTGGDLVKAVYVTRTNPQQRTAAVVSVFVDRFIGVITLALIAAVVLPFNLELFGEAAVGIYGFLVAAALGVFCVFSQRAKGLVSGLLKRLGFKPRGGKPGALSTVESAVSMYRHRLKPICLAVGLALVVHMTNIVALQVFAQALATGGTDALHASADIAPQSAEFAQQLGELKALGSVDVASTCSIVPIIMIISALPISPAGWGVGEAAFVYFFRTVSVAKKHAVALSVTFRITAMMVSLVGGLLLLIDRKRVMEAASSSGESASVAS